VKKFFALMLVSVLSIPAFSADATFFRVWQGTKKAEMSRTEFRDALPAFMAQADAVYGNTLNEYFVALTPAKKPAFVPDEFAMLSFADEQDYRRIRATPEGQAYGTAHGEIFDMTISKSASYEIGLPAALVSGNSYDLSPSRLDWSTGYTLFFIGTRKASVTPEQFLKDLHSHVALARTNLVPEGMRGYIVLANENFEAAYINWESKAAYDRAFARASGQAVGKDAGRFMDILMWEPVKTLRSPMTAGFFQMTRDPGF
jgi:hypothetical protein